MPTLKEQVEQRAKELYLTQWIIPPNEYEELNSEKSHQWQCTAKHCMAAEIRARLEELNNVCDDGHNSSALEGCQICWRMTELQDQLSSLENL